MNICPKTISRYRSEYATITNYVANTYDTDTGGACLTDETIVRKKGTEEG